MSGKMDALVGRITQTGPARSTNTISVRIPDHTFQTIHSLATHSGMSMNKVIVSLIECSVDEVLGRLGKEDLDAIAKLRASLSK